MIKLLQDGLVSGGDGHILGGLEREDKREMVVLAYWDCKRFLLTGSKDKG